MNQTRERLHDIEKNGYQIDFGNVFNHAFENYKKIAVYAGLVLIVFSILFSIFAIVSVFTIFGAKEITDNLTPQRLQSLNSSSNFVLIYSGIAFIISSLLSPFQAAFFKMADCGEKNQEFHVSTLFTYYKTPYFQQIILTTFIIGGLSFVQNQLLAASGLNLLGILISLIVSFLTFLSIPLVVFGDLKAIEAIKYSIMIVSKQPLILLGLLIVGGIATMVGVIGCCIGLFFTIPFIYSINYSIYSAIVGIDESPEIEDRLYKN